MSRMSPAPGRQGLRSSACRSRSTGARLNTLASANSRKPATYDIRKFIDGYCAERRLGFKQEYCWPRSIVTLNRDITPHQRSTCGRVQFGCEAENNGPLSPDLAAP